jgi:hypothetical protein
MPPRPNPSVKGTSGGQILRRALVAHMSTSRNGFWTLSGVIAGLVLSVAALGVLWIGTPWSYQFLMFAPFLLVAFLLRRYGRTSYPMLLGIVPVAALFVQFRDGNNSHLFPILLVATWGLAILLGHYLGGRWPTHASQVSSPTP